MAKKNDFIELVRASFGKETLKKLVFSRPVTKDKIAKASGRLCAHRGRRILALEYSHISGTVSQKNIKESELDVSISELLDSFEQANLITTLGDAEWKVSKKGDEVILGGDKLMRKMNGTAPTFVSAIESLDNKKNYILRGDEDFLIKLGISDKSGRVHDKKQGKFRQINRFLEHIEDVYKHLPTTDEIVVYDLCCGKSYLSFAVYYYLTSVKKRTVKMLGIDLKSDVIEWCDALAKELGYSGMTFICDDVTNTPEDLTPDMVISLHACDVATDIVLERAVELGASVILSTPCCHKYMNDKIKNESLKFVTDLPHLRNKLCEAMTDSLRIAKLRSVGYTVNALELTDPENTPKNTLIRAIRRTGISEDRLREEKAAYEAILSYLFGDKKDEYLKEFCK